MASSTLVQSVNSLLEFIGEIPYDWGSIAKSQQYKLFQYVAIYNNQISNEEEGEDVFDKPACFVEVDTGDYTPMLGGIGATDITYRLRIVGAEFDATNGTRDQNLTIFEYRDLVKRYLVNFTPLNGSRMMHIAEMQDTDHTAIYVWIMEFKTAFIDVIGSMYDEPNPYIFDYQNDNLALGVDVYMESDNILQTENLFDITDDYGENLTT